MPRAAVDTMRSRIATRSAQRRRRRQVTTERTLGPLVMRCRAFLVHGHGAGAVIIRDIQIALLQVMGPVPGVCRICACTEADGCVDAKGQSCSWANAARTVCSNPDCIAAARLG